MQGYADDIDILVRGKFEETIYMFNLNIDPKKYTIEAVNTRFYRNVFFLLTIHILNTTLNIHNFNTIFRIGGSKTDKEDMKSNRN